MKWIYIFVIVLISGCNLFKNTSKTTTSNAQSSAKQMESSQLILKTANKETQVFTYWNDSAFYQFQNIKERIDQAKSGQLKMAEKQKNEEEIKVKNSEPVKVWLHAGMLVALVTLAYWALKWRGLRT